ncbi:MAG: hypothetical protein M0Q95_15880 [Porticoccaceae bacterium]|jgi:hypothetical protein|nr:hypothetical protein [Porticoccaceae bacterium]
MASIALHNSVRKYHRFLGFFLAGIMALYACSGVLMIFRTTDFLKSEQTSERQLAPGLGVTELESSLRLKGFKITDQDHSTIRFEQGYYDKATGVATVTLKDYPAPIASVVKMHKATTNSPVYLLNIFFGLSLLFFAISSFFMFLPKLPQYRSGLKIATAGFVLALLVVVFSG